MLMWGAQTHNWWKNGIFVRSTDNPCIRILPHNQSIVKPKHSFHEIFNVTKGPKSDTIKAPYEKFQQTGNVNHDRSRNIGRPRTRFNFWIPSARDTEEFKTFRSTCCSSGWNTTHVSASYQAHSLHLFPYKTQILQPRSAAAINARETFKNAKL